MGLLLMKTSSTSAASAPRVHGHHRRRDSTSPDLYICDLPNLHDIFILILIKAHIKRMDAYSSS